MKSEKCAWIHIKFYYKIAILFFTLFYLHFYFNVCVRNSFWRKVERVWLRGSCESVPWARNFLLVVLHSWNIRRFRSVRETGVTKIKKKERKINVLGLCTKTFNLTHSRDTRVWKHYIREQDVLRFDTRALHFTSASEHPRECMRMPHAAIWELWDITGASPETNGKARWVREIIRGLRI